MADILKGKILTVAAQLSELQSVAESVQFSTLLSGAIGVQLDDIGRLVGEPRNGLIDSAYRLAIQGRCVLNISCGTIDAIILAVEKEVNGFDFSVEEYYPATVKIDLRASTPASMIQRVRQYKSAGVSLYSRETVVGESYLTWSQEGSVPPLLGGKYSEYYADGTIFALGEKYQKVFVK